MKGLVYVIDIRPQLKLVIAANLISHETLYQVFIVNSLDIN